MYYIFRNITPAVLRGAQYFPVTVITGPRQSGKSTFCRNTFNDYIEYNLEDLALREKIEEDPKLFLSECGEKVIIDEIQHVPSIFSYLQVEVDNHPNRRFIITGSSNFALMEKITQSLAGRTVLFTLLPLALNEIPTYANIDTDSLLFNGLFPSVVTGQRPADLFYSAYNTTYVEKDVRQLKNIGDLRVFQKFMRLAAGRTGSEINGVQFGNELAISSPTVKSWTSTLEASYILFPLLPYYANINKRLTKTPKVYFYDTGLLCYLLGIECPGHLRNHPLRGAIFENLAVVELLKQRFNEGKTSNLFFYRENKGREVDILRATGEYLDIFEVKSSHTYSSAFSNNLKYLKQLFKEKVKTSAVIYDGDFIPPDIVNIRQLTQKF